MIGRLRGEIVYKRPPWLMLEVHGVGYELEAPLSTFFDLPTEGGEVTLLTHLGVRDDAQVLYGFLREAERSLFRTLLRVNGVGARMALAILSGMDAGEFAQCIHAGDSARLTRLPGIGKKTAERLIVELRDRVEAPALTDAAPGGALPAAADTEAVSALVALGYRPAEAERMVRAVATPGLSSESLIRAALKASAPP